MADHPQQAVARTAPAQSGNLADVLERVLDKGIVIAGDIKLLLAEVEVLTLQIRLVICSVDKAQEIGLDWWRGHPAFGPYQKPELPANPVPRTALPEEPVAQQQIERQAELEERLARLERSMKVKASRREP